MILKDRWAKYVEGRHVEWTWDLLSGLYNRPDRHYHTLAHVVSCLELLDRFEIASDGAPDVVMSAELALFWHDAVYVPGDKRNEWLSANLLDALAEVLIVPATVQHLARKAVLATRTHTADGYGDPVSSIVVDIDLAILSVDNETYRKYTGDLRREYGFVSDAAWRVGRSEFLQKMIDRERIFNGVAPWLSDDRAKANMKMELTGLQGVI